MGQNTSVVSEQACSKLHFVSRLHIFCHVIDVGCLLLTANQGLLPP